MTPNPQLFALLALLLAAPSAVLAQVGAWGQCESRYAFQ
jgi:hypothetical protein